jgi:hypothetical protein
MEFLKLLFKTSGNVSIMKFLIPLLDKVSWQVSKSRGDCAKYLLRCMKFRDFHAVICSTWISIQGIDHCLVFDWLEQGRLEASQIEGIGLLIVRISSLRNVAEKFVERLKNLFKSNRRSHHLIHEFLLSFATLFGTQKKLMEDSSLLEQLVDESLFILSRLNKSMRELALACCTMLVVLGTNCVDRLHAFRSKVEQVLLRENLDLFALTRGYPKLREAISRAQRAWQINHKTRPSEQTTSPLSPPSSPSRRQVFHQVIKDSLSIEVEVSREKVEIPELPSPQNSSSEVPSPVIEKKSELSIPSVDFREILTAGTDNELIEFFRSTSPASIWQDESVRGTLFHVLVSLFHLETEYILPWIEFIAQADSASENLGVDDIGLLLEILIFVSADSRRSNFIRSKCESLLNVLFHD